MTGQRELPIIATMIGDPGGVGPEVTVKALVAVGQQRTAMPLLVGSACAVERAIRDNRVELAVRPIRSVAEAMFLPGAIDVLDTGALLEHDLTVGQPSAAAGHAVRSWLDQSAELAQRGEIDGWIMAPIDRTSLKLAGGMSDADEIGPPGAFLLRICGKLRVVPITEHIALRDVAASVTSDRLLKVVCQLNETLERWGMRGPRIALAGLNPHARGEEELRAIVPAVSRARAQGIDVTGPISPDSVFRQCAEGRYDVVVSMYHDQGQIALKTSAFSGACSVYIGLPYVHLTVPHGSAMDIAGRGVAQHASMLAAMDTAAALAAGQFRLHG